MSDGAIKRGGKHALMAAEDEQAARNLGLPIRCCDYWPECSHVLAWYELKYPDMQAAPKQDGEDATAAKGTGASA